MDIKTIETIIRENGYDDFQWISGDDVVVAQWPRFKCMYGCPSYGKKGTCPPSVPSVAECRQFFNEYKQIAVIHLNKALDEPNDRKKWSKKNNLKLLNLEKAIFLAGYPKAFLLFMDECRACEECVAKRDECKHPQLARPCSEALGVDVFSTVKKLGFPIQVLKNVKEEMNRYSFLMVE